MSLQGFCLVLLIGDLNNLEIWDTDICNAYLEALPSTKVYIIAGSEFKELEGHILVSSKVLHGLRSIGKRWHESFADCILKWGFFQYKLDPGIGMRQSGDIYEYVAVYVDDLANQLKNPKEIVDIL